MKRSEKNINYFNSIDSSELSSDISEEDDENQLEKLSITPIKSKGDFLSDYKIPSKMYKEKRSRFFSEDNNDNFHNRKSKYDLKIKKINKNLKNIAEGEITNLKTRKFTFS